MTASRKLAAVRVLEGLTEEERAELAFVCSFHPNLTEDDERLDAGLREARRRLLRLDAPGRPRLSAGGWTFTLLAAARQRLAPWLPGAYPGTFR